MNKVHISKFSLKLFVILILILICIFFELNIFYDYFYFSFYKDNKNPIKVAFYNYCLRNGGIERVTSILLNYLSKEKSFIFFAITVIGILEKEYPLPKNVKRISLAEQKKNIFEIIEKEKIDILIFNYDNKEEIEKMNKLNITKVIYSIHSSFFYRIYFSKEYLFEKSIYNEYKNCKYVTSLIPLENDYLFRKWGINSILLENPSTYEYYSINPSDLSKKNIIMIGRGVFPGKRFELGVIAMKNIIKEIPECQMNIISEYSKTLEELIINLKLEKNVRLTGFQINIEPYLKNSSLHIMPSLSEAYPMSLGEVKIFGIPSILCGLDYLALAEGGNIIIYDDNPDTLAKKSIKILKDTKLRKKLGKEARNSMKKISNHYIVKKWIKLLLSVYNGIDKSSYSKLFMNDRKIITEKKADIILNNQLNLLKKRLSIFSTLSLEKLKSYNLN